MRTHRLTAFAFIVFGYLAIPAFADGSFVKIGDVKGAAVEPQHKGWIEVGLWGTETRSGRWFWSSSIPVFWFEMRGDHAALDKALANKAAFDRVLFDVSIRGNTLRTTFTSAHVIAIERHGSVDKITVQFKSQSDQRVSFTASR